MPTKRNNMVSLAKLSAGITAVVVLAAVTYYGDGEGILSIPHAAAFLPLIPILFIVVGAAGSVVGYFSAAAVMEAWKLTGEIALATGLSISAFVITGVPWLLLIAIPRLFIWPIYEITVMGNALLSQFSIETIRSAVIPSGSIAQNFLYNDALYKRIHELVWSPVRDLANMGFALLLIAGAIITIARANKDIIAQYGPKFMIGIILVNFSWFIPRVVLDVANVSAVAAFSLASCPNCYIIKSAELSMPDDCIKAKTAPNTDPNTIECPTLFLRINKKRLPAAAKLPKPNPAEAAMGGLYEPLTQILRLPVLPRIGTFTQRLSKYMAFYNSISPVDPRSQIAMEQFVKARTSIGKAIAIANRVRSQIETAQLKLASVDEEVSTKISFDMEMAELELDQDEELTNEEREVIRENAELVARSENTKNVANLLLPVVTEHIEGQIIISDMPAIIAALIDARIALYFALDYMISTNAPEGFVTNVMQFKSNVIDGSIRLRLTEAQEMVSQAWEMVYIASEIETTESAAMAMEATENAFQKIVESIEALNNAGITTNEYLNLSLQYSNSIKLQSPPEPPDYPPNWIGIGNVFECIWNRGGNCMAKTNPKPPIPYRIKDLQLLMQATLELINIAGMQTIKILALAIISSISMVMYAFALIAMTAMVLLRIPIIWLTIGFMPIVALGFVIGRGGMIGGAMWKVWDTFVGAAFIPAAIGIPVAAGSLILHIAQSMPSNTSSTTGLMADIFGVNGIIQIMFIVIAIIVIWLGVFFAIGAINFAGEAQKAIGNRIRVLGQGAAMATGYVYATKVPILPVGKLDRVFGGTVGSLTAGTGWLAQKLGAKKIGGQLRQQGGEVIRAGGVGYVWEKGKQWKEQLGKTKTGQIINGTRKAIGGLFSGSALQKILVGAAVGAGTGRFDTVLQEYGRGEGSLKELISKRVRPQMSKDDAKGAAKKLDTDREKCDEFLAAAKAIETNPTDQAARTRLINVIEELRKDGINVDTGKGIPNAVKSIIETIRDDNTHSRQNEFHSLNATVIENNLIQAEQRAASSPPPTTP